MNQKQFDEWTKEFSKNTTLVNDPGFQTVFNMLGRMVMEIPSMIIFTQHFQAFIVWAFMAGLERGRKESAMQSLLVSDDQKNN